MLPFSESLGASPSLSVLRDDILQPTSLGFMKEIPDEDVVKRTELSTIIDDNFKVLKTVKLPDHLKLKELSEALQKIIKQDMEKDPLHDVAVRLTSYSQNFFEKMEPYFEEIFDYDEKVRERLRACLYGNSKEYVLSDLPPSYARSLALSFFTECKYHEIFDYRIRRERLKLMVVRNNRLKFKGVCDEHNRWVDFLHSLLESMRDSRTRLIWYVDLNNCKTVKEAFKFKELRKSNLDSEHFFTLLLDMQKETEKLRKALIEMSKETFQIAVDLKSSTVNLLCNVIEIMNT